LFRFSTRYFLIFKKIHSISNQDFYIENKLALGPPDVRIRVFKRLSTFNEVKLYCTEPHTVLNINPVKSELKVKARKGI
jgi:hypothetical protein